MYTLDEIMKEFGLTNADVIIFFKYFKHALREFDHPKNKIHVIRPYYIVGVWLCQKGVLSVEDAVVRLPSKFLQGITFNIKDIDKFQVYAGTILV